MTRARFFAALAGVCGVAKAQTVGGAVGSSDICWPRIPFNPHAKNGIKMCADVNNQCPVCGEMAEPLTPIKSGLQNCRGTGDGYTAVCEDVFVNPDSPQLTRCKRCSAAFFRDYEVKP